jgi:hypothetical protein
VRPSLWVLYVEPLLGVIAFSVAVGTYAAVNLIAATSYNDFTVFIESARALRHGLDVYQRSLPPGPGPGFNLNAPAAVLFFVPLSYLPDAAALRLWTVVAIALFLLASYWIAKSVVPPRFVSVAAAILLWQPVIIALLLGQISAVLMVVVTAAWIADRTDRPLRAGVLVGVAIAAKPFLAPLGAYALWRRSPRLIAGICVGAAAVLVAGLAAVGVDGYRSWIAAIGQVSWIGHVANASLDGLLTRTLSVTPEVLRTTPVMLLPGLVQPLWWAGIVVVAGIAVLTIAGSDDLDRAWAIVLIGSLLVSPLGWTYYATMFAGPLLAVALKAPMRERVLIAAGYACLLLPPMPSPPFGAVGVLLRGSIYAWGLVLTFAAVALTATTVRAREEIEGSRRKSSVYF